MAARTLLLCVLVCGGCCRRPPPVAPVTCRPPPTPQEELVMLAGPAEGCPEPWAACLDAAAGLALEYTVRGLRRYVAEVEALCR